MATNLQLNSNMSSTPQYVQDAAGPTNSTLAISSGNIGIGTTGPGTNLDTVGGLRVKESSTLNVAPSGRGVEIYYRTDLGLDQGLVQAFNRTTGVTGKLILYGNSLLLNPDIPSNVGIGNTNPGAKLEVTGNLYLSSGADRKIEIPDQTVAGSGNSLTLEAGSAFGSNNAGGDIILMPGVATGTGKVGAVGIGTNPAVGHNLEIYDPSSVVVLGLVPASSTAKCEILFSSGASEKFAIIYDPTVGTSGSLEFMPGNIGGAVNTYVDRATGFLGIGTSSPATALELSQPGAGQTAPAITFDNQGSNVFTMGVDTADSNKFKIGTTALGTNTRLSIDATGIVSLLGTALQANAGTAASGVSGINSFIYAQSGGTTGGATNGGNILLMPGAGFNGGLYGNVGIATASPNSTLQINGSVAGKRTAVANTNYTSSNEMIIGVSTSTAAVTVTLATTNAVAGRVLIIKDEGGVAATRNITISRNGRLIDGAAANKIINSNYGVIRLYSDGTNWFTC